MSVQPGSTQVSSLTSETTGLVGTLTWRLIASDNTVTIAAATTGITEGPTGTYVKSYTAPATEGTYQPIWNDGADQPDPPIVVKGNPVPSGVNLTSVAAVRAFLQKQTPDTAQDAVILSLINRASVLIMREAEREFAPTSSGVTRTFEVGMQDGQGVIALAPYDLRAITSINLDTDQQSPVSMSADEYHPMPINQPDGVYTQIRLRPLARAFGRVMWPDARVAVTGDWGFPSVPPDVEDACIKTVAIWLRREVQAFSQTFNIDTGQLEIPQSLPSAVWSALGSYRRVAV